MPKAKVKVQVFKCRCSTCKQEAMVEPGKIHHYCSGLALKGPLPPEFKGLHNPNKKGIWTKLEDSVQAP